MTLIIHSFLRSIRATRFRENLVQFTAHTFLGLAEFAVMLITQEIIANERVVNKSLKDHVEKTSLSKV